MLLNSVHSKVCRDNPHRLHGAPCYRFLSTAVPAIQHFVSDKDTLWAAPRRAVVVKRIGADLGIKPCFPVVITKATDPCSPLSEAKQAKVTCGNSTWSIYFVIYSDKGPNWGKFSWKHLLMGLSTQGSGVTQEMAHLSCSSPCLSGGDGYTSLLCQPPCPNTGWGIVAHAGEELCVWGSGPQQSCLLEPCVFRSLCNQNLE